MADVSARWWALSQEEQNAINAEKKARGELPIPTHRHRPIGRMRSVAATFAKPDGNPLITFRGDDADGLTRPAKVLPLLPIADTRE